MHKISTFNPEGLGFPLFNHKLRCQAVVDKCFPDYVSLNYAHAGCVRHRIGDGPERLLHAPVAWWTWPGPRFFYGNRVAPGWDHYYVCFKGKVVKEWAREGWLPPSDPAAGWRHPRCPEAFRDKMLFLHAQIAAGRARRSMLALLDLLLDVNEGDISRDSLGERVRAVADTLRSRPAAGCDEDSRAHRLGVSTSHFRRLFLRETGLPPHRFIIDARLQNAAARLRTTDHPLKHIAAECGFFDEYHLSRLFHRKFGLPPGAYRRQTQSMG
jgi:AraC-like DNA-binding protein